MSSDDGLAPVEAVDWCSADEAFEILEDARPGAPIQVDWDRFLEAVNPAGERGFYRAEIESEAAWQAQSTVLTRSLRTALRTTGILVRFVFSLGLP